MLPYRLLLAAWCSLLTAVLPAYAAEPPHSALYSSLRWRMIGPFRGGRTVAATYKTLQRIREALQVCIENAAKRVA